MWGYEASLVVTGSDNPDTAAPLHKPGRDPGQNAVRAIRSINRRGHPANWLAGDRAYTNAKPENFQLPDRALGYRPVLGYKIDQLGIQDSYGGMLLVDETYCPSIPTKLINATIDARNGDIDETTHRARLEERWRYRILPKASPDAEGHVRLRCPAANPSPVARCDDAELKSRSERLETRGKLRVQVLRGVAAHPRFGGWKTPLQSVQSQALLSIDPG